MGQFEKWKYLISIYSEKEGKSLKKQSVHSIEAVHQW